MGFSDSPQPPEKPNYAEVEIREEADDNKNPLQAEALGFLARAPVKDIGGDTQTTVRDRGQVESMKVPTGWDLGHDGALGGVGTRSLKEFHPPGDPDAKLCFYYRGLPESENAGRIFRHVLDKPAHDLSPAEIESLSDVLKARGNKESFDLKQARTEDIDGKRVLVIDGSYKANGSRLHEIFVDARGDGRVVQEIYFQAPPEAYDRHGKDVDAAFKTLKWKAK